MDKKLKKKVKVVKVVKKKVNKVTVASQTLLDWAILQYLSD
jgi:hypothetical protein